MKNILCKLGRHKWTKWFARELFMGKWPTEIDRVCKWCEKAEIRYLTEKDLKWYGGYGKSNNDN